MADQHLGAAHPPPDLEPAGNGQVQDSMTGKIVDGINLFGTAPVAVATESPVTTVTRWRDWRFGQHKE